MPTLFRRVQLTLTPELDPLLRELSQLTGKPEASILREMMVSAVPALTGMRDALRLVREQPRKAVRLMERQLDRAVGEAQQLRLDLPRKRKRRRSSG